MRDATFTPQAAVFYRVAATAWLNHALRCGVRRCRRAGRCLAVEGPDAVPRCMQSMSGREAHDMITFMGDTADVMTPDMVEALLAQAETPDERDMVVYRRNILIYYWKELEKAGLPHPEIPPFMTGVTP